MALAQGRYGQGKNRQSVEQVCSETALCNLLRQVPVGGSDQTNIQPDGMVGAQALDFTILQGTEQLGLDGQGQLTNFIQKQRATLGRFKTSVRGVHERPKMPL